MALVLCAGLPAAAAAFPPVRVIAGERSAVAATGLSCEPQSGGVLACASASFAAGPGFPPTLAASPGSQVVIDTESPATAVQVTSSRLAQRADSSELPVRRIDASHWAISMPTSNISASIAVEYGSGGNTGSFLTLRRIVATSDEVTSVDGHGEVVAWSERPSGGGAGPSSGSYHLTALIGGAVRRLPVAPRSVPFDVDLGPDRRGSTVAVYSRCAREPDLPAAGRSPLAHPSYTRGRGCDIYRFDFATGRERKLAGASTAGASEVLPSVWRDKIAFARVYERRAGARGLLPYLYVRPLSGGRSQRQPGGARGKTGLPGPISLDLYGRRLSFVWNRATAHSGVSELRLDTLNGPHEVVDRTRRSGATFVSTQGADGRLFYAARQITAPGSGKRVDRLLRRRLSSDTIRLAGSPQDPTGVAVTGHGSLFAASRDDDGGTSIIDVSQAGFFRGR